MKRVIKPFIAFLAVSGLAIPASADVTLDFDLVLTGDTPVGTSPWARVTLEDIAADTVRVTVSNLMSFDSGQFLSLVLLSVDPFIGDLAASNFVNANKFESGSEVAFSEDGFNNASYTFDLEIQFETSGSGGGVNRLKGGESAGFDLTGNGLSSASFLSLVAGGDGKPDTLGMIHVQAIPGNGEGSSKIGVVPEPASLVALGIGALGLARRRWRSR